MCCSRLGRAKNDAYTEPTLVEALWRREVAEEHTDRTKALGKGEIAELLDQKMSVHEIERYDFCLFGDSLRKLHPPHQWMQIRSCPIVFFDSSHHSGISRISRRTQMPHSISQRLLARICRTECISYRASWTRLERSASMRWKGLWQNRRKHSRKRKGKASTSCKSANGSSSRMSKCTKRGATFIVSICEVTHARGVHVGKLAAFQLAGLSFCHVP